MNDIDVLATAWFEVGYHEKITNTPVPYLYDKTNAYDGSNNWTKYHNDLGIAQGLDWCGFFAYWCFWEQYNGSFVLTNQFLHNMQNLGGAVSDWENAFDAAGKFWFKGTYNPKPGDVVIFSDDIYPWSHCEIVEDVSGLPNTIQTIGGNTRNPDDPGDQSRGMYVAQRVRSMTATTQFWVRGFCEVDYDNTPGYLQTWMAAGSLRKKRRHMFGKH